MYVSKSVFVLSFGRASLAMMIKHKPLLIACRRLSVAPMSVQPRGRQVTSSFASIVDAHLWSTVAMFGFVFHVTVDGSKLEAATCTAT